MDLPDKKPNGLRLSLVLLVPLVLLVALVRLVYLLIRSQ
jgi:hypothetical protein